MQNMSETEVRGIKLRLVTYTRALKLCARMNRELEVLDFIDQIDSNQVFYDLGACEGRFSLYAAAKGIQCYAVEPEKRNFEALLENISINDPKIQARITPLNLAVGEDEKKVTLRIGQPWAGGHQKVISRNSSRTDLDFEFCEEQVIEQVSLDFLLKTRSLPTPNYLKVDIDGSEIPFLQGAIETFSNPALRSVIFELHLNDRSHESVCAQLNAYGFLETGRFEVESQLFNVVFKRF